MGGRERVLGSSGLLAALLAAAGVWAQRPVIPVTAPRRFDILQSGPWPTGGAPRPTLILWIVKLEIENGDRQRQMVQSDQRLWIYSAARRGQRCLCSHLGSRTCWTEHAQRGAANRV